MPSIAFYTLPGKQIDIFRFQQKETVKDAFVFPIIKYIYLPGGMNWLGRDNRYVCVNSTGTHQTNTELNDKKTPEYQKGLYLRSKLNI